MAGIPFRPIIAFVIMRNRRDCLLMLRVGGHGFKAATAHAMALSHSKRLFLQSIHAVGDAMQCDSLLTAQLVAQGKGFKTG